jgi:hypothetical protein
MKMEQRGSNSGDFCTRSDPLPTVPCTLYLLLDRLASGLLGLDGRYVVNKVDDDISKLRSGALYIGALPGLCLATDEQVMPDDSINQAPQLCGETRVTAISRVHKLLCVPPQ